jgi:hypothetical protein
MKKYLVVLFVAGLMAVPIQAELVTNGGFESDLSTGWWNWSPDTETQSIIRQDVVVYGGSYSVEMDSATDGTWQELGTNAFEVDADTTYSLSLVYNEVGWVGAGINLKYWDADWTEVGSQQWIDLVYSTEEGTETWTAFGTDFTTAAGAVYMEVKIAQGGWGTLYVDNVSVVPEPATLALMALGSTLLMRRRRK